MKKFVAVALVVALCGCVNQYARSYQPVVDVAEYAQRPRLLPNDGEPKLIKVNIDDAAAIKSFEEEGYVLVGSSTFKASRATEASLIEQAKAVRAHAVLYGKTYAGTKTTMIPVTTPTVQTTYHDGSVYGAGGGYGTYSGTSTTRGTSTSYIPLEEDRYEYEATFWVKRRDGGLGIAINTPTADIRAKNGTNKGVVVATVFRGSSAFKADIVDGDQIVRIGTADILDVKSANEAMRNYYGRPGVEVELVRNGTRLVKKVDMDPEFK